MNNRPALPRELTVEIIKSKHDSFVPVQVQAREIKVESFDVVCPDGEAVVSPDSTFNPRAGAEF